MRDWELIAIGSVLDQQKPAGEPLPGSVRAVASRGQRRLPQQKEHVSEQDPLVAWTIKESLRFAFR